MLISTAVSLSDPQPPLSPPDMPKASSEPPREEDDKDIPRTVDDEKDATRKQRVEETPGTLEALGPEPTVNPETSNDRSTTPRGTPPLEAGSPASNSPSIWGPPTPPAQLPTPPDSVRHPYALRRNNAMIFSWGENESAGKEFYVRGDEGLAASLGEGGSGSKVRTWSRRRETDEQKEGEKAAFPTKMGLESGEELVDPPSKRRKGNPQVKRKTRNHTSRTFGSRIPQQTSLPTPPSTPETRGLRPRKPKRL